MDAILEMRGAEAESASIDQAEDMVLDSLFNVTIEKQSEPRGHSKRHHSSRTTEALDDSRARTKERTNLDGVRKFSLIDEESHKIKV